MGFEEPKYFLLGCFKGIHFDLYIQEMFHKHALIIEKSGLRCHHGGLLILGLHDLSSEGIIIYIKKMSWS